MFMIAQQRDDHYLLSGSADGAIMVWVVHIKGRQVSSLSV